MELSGPGMHRRASIPAVLDFAWDAGIFRADHAMSALSLTRSTALSALDALISLGLIDELPPEKTRERLGRPARHFELCRRAGVLIGIDAGDHQITAVAADLQGNPIGRIQTPTQGYSATNSDSATRRRAVIQTIDALLEAGGWRQADAVSITIGIPAPVDSDGNSPHHRSGFWKHMNADLCQHLAERFPHVRIENDAALAAIAEHQVGCAQGRRHFVAMLSGRRLGSGVFLEGRLTRGTHGGVGELEALCYVAGVGCTDGFGPLTERHVRESIAHRQLPAGHPWSALGIDLSAETALAAATLADPVTAPLLQELGATLGRICSVVCRFYDPEVIVICGAMAPSLGAVIRLAQKHLNAECELPAPRIVASELASDVVCLGAVAAARETARGTILDLYSSV